MAHIIGITGLAGAGKDTCALAMRGAFSQEGVRAVLEGYADPIRKIAYTMGLNPYDRSTKEAAVTMRVDRFCDYLQGAIDIVLTGRMSEAERNLLYRYTVAALAIAPAVPGKMTISPRVLMQVLGTEGGQRIRRTLWVELAAARWDDMPGYVLVTDFRFMHELDPLDEIWCVVRKGTERVNDHVSEDLADMLTKEQPRYLDGKAVAYLKNNRSQEKFETRAASCAIATHRIRNPV